jgi:hypothetical protein
MFKNNSQRLAFFSNMKKRGTLNNPAANEVPKAPAVPKMENIGQQPMAPTPPPALSSAQNALNGVTGKFPKFGNIKKLMKPKF